MQYIRHNFAENYHNFTKSGELSQRNDMLIDEIAKLIVFDKVGLILAIANAGFNIKRVPNKKEFITFFQQNISKNAKLRDGLARLIIINNSKLPTVKHKSTEFNSKTSYTVGDKTYGKGLTENKKLTDSEKELSASLNLNFTGNIDLETKVEQHIINKMVKDNAIVSQEDMAKAVRKTKIKTVLYTTAILVGGYFILNYLAKKYATSTMFANGGNINANPQPIQQSEPLMAQPPLATVNAGGFDEFGLKAE